MLWVPKHVMVHYICEKLNTAGEVLDVFALCCATFGKCCAISGKLGVFVGKLESYLV